MFSQSCSIKVKIELVGIDLTILWSITIEQKTKKHRKNGPQDKPKMMKTWPFDLKIMLNMGQNLKFLVAILVLKNPQR